MNMDTAPDIEYYKDLVGEYGKMLNTIANLVLWSKVGHPEDGSIPEAEVVCDAIHILLKDASKRGVILIDPLDKSER